MSVSTTPNYKIIMKKQVSTHSKMTRQQPLRSLTLRFKTNKMLRFPKQAARLITVIKSWLGLRAKSNARTRHLPLLLTSPLTTQIALAFVRRD